MQKIGVLLIISLLFLSVFSGGFVLADKDKDGSDDGDDNSGSSESSDSGSDGGDDSKENSRGTGKDGVKEEDSSGKKEVESDGDDDSKDSDDSRIGTRERKETRFEEKIENGKREGRFEEDIRYRDENGVLQRAKIKIEVKQEDDGTIERKIKVTTKSGEEFEVKSELEIEEDIEGNLSRVRIRDSEGNRTELRVLPDRAAEIARERLQARNISIEIREVEDSERNVPRVVYHAEADRPGRFLGIFKIKARYEASIDAETGEVVEFNGPWWAFLLVPEEEPGEPIGNETGNNETIGNDTIIEEPVLNETIGNETVVIVNQTENNISS